MSKATERRFSIEELVGLTDRITYLEKLIREKDEHISFLEYAYIERGHRINELETELEGLRC